MPRSGRSNSKIHNRGSTRDDVRIGCNCGWELRLGYGVAVSLAIFEAKRFFLLALELFVEWQVIRFAGGYTPVVLTFVDISLGFPCALAAVYTIRKSFVYLLTIITICGVLNVATMITIGYDVSVRQRSLARVFNASMQLYVTSVSSKYAVDQIQLVLQCCGHTSYDDWFLLDWQMVDYASREDMSRQRIISDEIYRDRGVPFSCCNFRVLRACVHYQMTDYDADTVNVEGCAGALSNVLVRIVFVAYVMTTMLVMTQALLAFFVARIVDKFLSNSNRFSSKTWKKTTNGTSRPLVESTSPLSSDEYSSSIEKSFGNTTKTAKSSRRTSELSMETRKTSTGSRKKPKSRKIDKNVQHSAVVSGFSDLPENSVASSIDESDRETARIKPSVHVEHRVPKKKPGVKTIR